MKRSRTTLFRAGLDTMHLSMAHRVLAPFTRGMGAIFTLHHVEAAPQPDFAPNRILSVTPEFLEAAVLRLRQHRIELVSLDEARRRIVGATEGPRFACITFDDGYRDNLEVAYPVLKRHEVPFTIYVTSCLPDGTARLWWRVLERVVGSCGRVEIDVSGERIDLRCESSEEKYDAYERLYWALRSLPESELAEATDRIASRFGIDQPALVRGMSMSWEEISRLSANPLVTIGAHTQNHPALGKLSAAEADREMVANRQRIAEMTGRAPGHLAFPYGDPASAGAREFERARKLGFATAVTTRPGMLFPEHREHLTALPRISLNGDYQSLRYLDLYLTGAPFALWNRFRRVNAA